MVEKALGRDKEALGELFRRYQKSFFNLAYRFLGDYYLADDLTSEIFLRIYKYLKKFDRNLRFKSWAFKIATNTCLTFKAKNLKLKTKNFNLKLKAEGEQVEQEGREVELADTRVDLVKETEKNEISERVQKALQLLPEKYRLALYLYYFEDLRYEEVANDLGLPVNTVRTHKSRPYPLLSRRKSRLTKLCDK